MVPSRPQTVLKNEARQRSPEVKKQFDAISNMIKKILDTKAIEKIKDFRKQENYLYCNDFTETFEEKLNRKYDFLNV